MPKFPKPWFRPSRRTWYVQLDGKQHNLGPDKDQAFERYHELMRSRPKEADCSLAVGVLDAFLSWVKENKSPRTFEWYQRHCEAFAKSIPPLLPVGQLKPFHLTRLLAAHPDWSSSTKNGVCRAVCRAFKWAEDEELILRSPLRKVKKPKAKRREVVITPEEFDEMLAAFPAECIQDLLVTVWETGCRPQELVAVERRHVDPERGRWVFPTEESKGEARPRVVYLTPRALKVTRRLVVRHPEGPLFRNTGGNAWNRHSLSCVFGRLQVRLGLRRMKELGVTLEPVKRFRKSDFADKAALEAGRAEQEDRIYERRKALYKLARKHGRKYTLYHLRHSWATRALQRGVDPLTVATLMGHADPSMLAKVYAHLAQDPEYLQKAARKAAGGEGGA